MKRLALIQSLLLLLSVFAAAQKYEITDLTLGGSQSRASGINARGQVSGTADLPGGGTSHAFLYSRGHMIDLGTLGGTASWATAINANGQVTGTAGTRNEGHAFLYSNGHMKDLGTLGAGQYGLGDYSYGNAINARGQVTGSALFIDTSCCGVGRSDHAFLYSDGQMKDLGTSAAHSGGDYTSFGGDYSRGVAINDSGQVTGEVGVYFWDHASTPLYHAFLYSRGQMVDLGTLFESFSSPTAINARGQVLGWGDSSFLYTHGHMIDLPLQGWALNDFGEVTGCVWAWSPETGSYVVGAALYWRGQVIDLGTGKGSCGYALSDFGQVTGTMPYPGDDAGHAFTFIPGRGVVDLNEAIPHNSGWILHQGTGINNRGQIIGYGTINGQSHAFLLTPINRYKAFVRSPIGSDDKRIFKASRGVIPVKFTLKENDVATCGLPPATISVIRTGGETLGSIDQHVYSTSANIGSNFRIDPTACQYIYNLAVRPLGPGVYRVEISIDGSVVGDAVFALQ